MAGSLASVKLATTRLKRELQQAYLSPWAYLCSLSFNVKFMAAHVTSILVFSMIYYSIAYTSGVKLGLVNSFFLAASIQTNTGLNPLNLQDLGRPIQALMLVQMELGSHRFVAMLCLWMMSVELKAKVQRRLSPLLQMGIPNSGGSMRHIGSDIENEQPSNPLTTFDSDFGSDFEDVSLESLANRGLTPNLQQNARVARPLDDVTPIDIDFARGRNGQFADLSDGERDRLEDFEYNSAHFLLWHNLVLEVLLLGIAASAGALNEDTARSSLNARWVGVYTMLSGLQNNGTNLLPNGMASFATSTKMQLPLCIFMMVGNTCWPILLHVLIWLEWLICKALSKNSQKWAFRSENLSFLLKNSRRCYLFLYPTKHTVWLAISVFLFCLTDWWLFMLMSFLWKERQSIPTGQWFLNGFFQCLALRTTGYTIIGLSNMPELYQFLLIIMIYFAIYPTVINMRSSNPLEERALGIYDQDEEVEPPRKYWFQYIRRPSESDRDFLDQQIQDIRSYDIAILIIAIMLILLCRMFEITSTSTIFAVSFEVFSAYRNVGLSMGVPNDGYSYSGSWNGLSRAILTIVMILGKFRCLPATADMATMRHGAEEAAQEDQDAKIRLGRREDRRDDEARRDRRRLSLEV